MKLFYSDIYYTDMSVKNHFVILKVQNTLQILKKEHQIMAMF